MSPILGSTIGFLIQRSQITFQLFQIDPETFIGSRGFLGVHRETGFTEKDVIHFPSFSRFRNHLRRSGEMIRDHSVSPSLALPRATATRNGSLKI
jgi:hypothetical protein